MEKQLKTKEEIYDDGLFQASTHFLRKREVLSAMTEWGNQEYQQGVRYGEKTFWGYYWQFFIIAFVAGMLTFGLLGYKYAEYYRCSQSQHYKAIYTRILIEKAAEKKHYESIILNKSAK